MQAQNFKRTRCINIKSAGLHFFIFGIYFFIRHFFDIDVLIFIKPCVWYKHVYIKTHKNTIWKRTICSTHIQINFIWACLAGRCMTFIWKKGRWYHKISLMAWLLIELTFGNNVDFDEIYPYFLIWFHRFSKNIQLK